MAFDAQVVVQGGGAPPLAPRDAARFLRVVARRLRVPGSAAVAFMDDEAMRRLNRRFRRKDRTTDVLSFPDGEEGRLGDIAISVPTTRRQARRRGHPASRETRLLLLHGFLHLLGYDHETDDGQMELLERGLRQELVP
ncbi:MAG: rRNA maturation RNase YbeY [Candidatus Polarisedimenticolia bacterium]